MVHKAKDIYYQKILHRKILLTSGVYKAAVTNSVCVCVCRHVVRGWARFVFMSITIYLDELKMVPIRNDTR